MVLYIPEAVEIHLRSKTHIYALRIRELLAGQLATSSEIARQLGIDVKDVRRVAAAIGVKPTGKARLRELRMTDKIRELAAQGPTTYTEIGKALGISAAEVSRIASAVGIKVNKMRRCECGMRLKISTQSASHRQSAVHIYGARIRRLLERDCISFADIGNRLDLTRERVRQIARALGLKTGRERQRTCKISRMFQTHPWLEELRTIAADRELFFEATSTGTKSVKLNGLSCAVRSVSNMPNSTFSIYPPARQDYDFFLGKTALGWLVIPRERMPRKQTSLVLGRSKLATGATGSRHDWQSYFDAWHLLGSVGKDPAARR